MLQEKQMSVLCVVARAAAVGYLEHIRLDLTADFPWKEDNLAYANRRLPFGG